MRRLVETSIIQFRLEFEVKRMLAAFERSGNRYRMRIRSNYPRLGDRTQYSNFGAKHWLLMNFARIHLGSEVTILFIYITIQIKVPSHSLKYCFQYLDNCYE